MYVLGTKFEAVQYKDGKKVLNCYGEPIKDTLTRRYDMNMDNLIMFFERDDAQEYIRTRGLDIPKRSDKERTSPLKMDAMVLIAPDFHRYILIDSFDVDWCTHRLEVSDTLARLYPMTYWAIKDVGLMGWIVDGVFDYNSEDYNEGLVRLSDEEMAAFIENELPSMYIEVEDPCLTSTNYTFIGDPIRYDNESKTKFAIIRYIDSTSEMYMCVVYSTFDDDILYRAIDDDDLDEHIERTFYVYDPDDIDSILHKIRVGDKDVAHVLR